MITFRQWSLQVDEEEEEEPAYGSLSYFEARREHAFLLKCEGLSLRRIGDRLGITPQRVRQMVFKVSRKLNTSMRRRKTKFRFLKDVGMGGTI